MLGQLEKKERKEKLIGHEVSLLPVFIVNKHGSKCPMAKWKKAINKQKKGKMTLSKLISERNKQRVEPQTSLPATNTQKVITFP